MIEIKNLRVEKPKKPWDVRVDRATILGNPFFMSSELQRDDVCDRYSEYFNDNFGVELKEELNRIIEIHKKYGKLSLFCWCAPKRCHAETIKAFLEGRFQCQR